MAIERARAHLARHGVAERLIETAESSATVELAAKAVGIEPRRIAKSLSFLVDGAPVLVVAAGDAKVDNRRFRDTFGVKARMIPAAEVEDAVGHAVGGVCPFGVNEGVRVYLDDSLRRFETVFPAAGSGNSAIELGLDELERISEAEGWVAVTVLPEGSLP
ncbi:YbaK/EbsC family protein [Propioniciclava sp.]|uniref:YbaK/EbsC family protein n=1 Tax=Propioniciclava sp. TaxID=2038686 RepID=UPI0026090863|nr:YbaK/EbsC family protein [Propioniciclava sp.]